MGEGLGYRRRLRLAVTAAVAVSAAAGLVGCSTNSSGQAETANPPGCKPAKKPVTLNYWTWGAGYEDAAKLWNSKHPDIQVKFSGIPVGPQGGYQKMFTALKAGTEPDVGFVEFDTVPAFASQGALLDVASCLGEAKAKEFLPGILDQEALSGAGSLYGVPVGSGPMALFYRKDLFSKNKIPVPTTWEEFARSAARVREIDPSAHLANFDGNAAPNWFAGMASQNAAQWFHAKGSTWQVSIDDAATHQVADLWQQLLASGQVSSLATFSPEWNAALASGKLWSWPSAVWGAGIIKSAAPKTSGDWGVAPLPSWGPGKPGSASWGGGGLSVFKSTKHPYEAAQFALWMGTDPEAMKILNKAIGIYPTTDQLLKDPLFSEPDSFFDGQKIFDQFRTASDNLPHFTWGPSMTDTYSALGDAFSNATSAKNGTVGDAVASAQATTVAALKKQGFTVTP